MTRLLVSTLIALTVLLTTGCEREDGNIPERVLAKDYKADLVPTSLSLLPSDLIYDTGETVSMTLVVENQGKLDARDFHIAFYVGQEGLERTKIVETIFVGTLAKETGVTAVTATVVMDDEWIPNGTVGTLYGVVDPLGEVVEESNSNNTISEDIMISPTIQVDPPIGTN